MQTTDTVLMIEPVAFGYNAETAKNNYFQKNTENKDTQSKALSEFHGFVEKLQNKGIQVITIKDTPEPHTPDSIFPNNWISMHADGRIFIYPMCAVNRRWERRKDILEMLQNDFEVNEIIDLSDSEIQEKYLEGTGSMIFDHDNKIVYGSVSIRLHEELFINYCQKINYTPVVFHSFQSANGERLPIYHTNVMMCVADNFVVICLDCIDDESERKKVEKTIQNSGKKIIEISESQLQNFAGNMLQLNNKNGDKFLVMSQTAYKSLENHQIKEIEKYSEIVYADLSTIETNGGGSARCMLAEVFLKKK